MDFFRRIIKLSEQTFRVSLHSASHYNFLKKDVTVNQKEKRWRGINLIKQKCNKGRWF